GLAHRTLWVVDEGALDSLPLITQRCGVGERTHPRGTIVGGGLTLRAAMRLLGPSPLECWFTFDIGGCGPRRAVGGSAGVGADLLGVPRVVRAAGPRRLVGPDVGGRAGVVGAVGELSATPRFRVPRILGRCSRPRDVLVQDAAELGVDKTAYSPAQAFSPFGLPTVLLRRVHPGPPSVS
ncbi:MAG: hypothetical protein DLM62_19505, partial [Pseudonocardiales bacterium]